MLRTPALVSLAAALQLACRQTRTASPWSERGAGGDVPRLRRLLLQAGVLLLHGLAIWGVVQTAPVHDTVKQAAPLFVHWVTAPAAPATPAAPAAQATPAALRAGAPTPPMPSSARPPLAQIILPDSPVPGLPEATLAPVQPADTPTPAAPATAVATIARASLAAVPTLPDAAAPRLIPNAALHYLVAPVVNYPRQSRRQRETGLVVVRAFIDSAGGAPRTVQLNQSSGFALLDAAALAAVQAARFKPSMDNGRPVEGWALIPIRFELET